MDLWEKTYLLRPTFTAVSKEAKVATSTARKYIKEYLDTGDISDPKKEQILRKANNVRYVVIHLLTFEEEQFVLSIRAEDSTTPLEVYRMAFIQEFDKKVSVSYLHNWFKYRFEYRGNLRRSNLIPKDKFTEEGWLKYYEFRMIINKLSDHTLYNFVDEKHLVNHNGTKLRGRIDPVTGILNGIPVDGNFRDAHNLICCISGNHRKERHVFYAIGKDNGTAEAFMNFVERMVAEKFLIHGEILILDNAAVHTSGAADILEDYLWTTVVDGRPLNVFVVFLPPRAPELNPIELVFNILVGRLKGFHYRNKDGVKRSVLDKVEYILSSMSYETILNCFFYCGYLLNNEPQKLS